MPEADFYAYWKLGYLLGAVVVAAVAALLIAILLVARNILHLAGAALGIAGTIEERTRPIWSLGEANDLVANIVATVRRIEDEARAIADRLVPGPAAGGRP